MNILNLYRTAIVAVMVTAIVAVAGPSTGYYPKTASFPPKTCGNDQVITWESPAWVCKSVGGGGSGSISGVVTAVSGTLPIVATTTDAGVVTVSEAIAPDGGIDITGTGIKIAQTIDVATLRIGGITAMGPSHTGTIDVGVVKVGGITAMGPSGIVYSGGTTVAITHSDVTNGNVALTTEGTIDWQRITNVNVAQCANATVPRKITSVPGFSCDSPNLLFGASTTGVNGSDSTLTFTATDGIDAVASGNTTFVARTGSPAGIIGAGFSVTISGANASTRVARIYWSEFSVVTTVCTVRMPDGTTASDTVTGTDNTVNAFSTKITYTSPIAGSVNLSCVVTVSGATGSPALGPRVMTLGVI